MAEVNFEDLVQDTSYSMGGGAEREQAILDELERKKRARSMAVPTDDNKVKLRLRELGEPITLFGERAADRRDRLVHLLSQINAAGGDVDMRGDSDSDKEEEKVEEFYTLGSMELLECRRRLAEFSLPRARQRIEQQQKDANMSLNRILDIRKRVFAEVKSFANIGSQIGDERPIAQVRFSPNSKYLATGSWSGNVKVWNVPECTPVLTCRGHGDRVGGVVWHPQATIGLSEGSANLVSGAADCTVNLWSLKSEQPLAVMKGHQDRVCRVAFHPSGDYVASASLDTTWRLWDVNNQRELLLQEGHSEGVYTIDFQDDGSLAASGGLDAIGRVWDLRTGRTAMVLDGHVQSIFALSFAPNGYQIATGSGDDTIRLWDLRALKSLYNIAAHRSNVADLRWFRGDEISRLKPLAREAKMEGVEESKEDNEAGPAKPSEHERLDDELYRSGLYLASAGYDGFVKIWSADDWQLLRTLTTDGGKVMSVDFSSDKSLLASGTYNRNFQLYAPELVAPVA